MHLSRPSLKLGIILQPFIDVGANISVDQSALNAYLAPRVDQWVESFFNVRKFSACEEYVKFWGSPPLDLIDSLQQRFPFGTLVQSIEDNKSLV